MSKLIAIGEFLIDFTASKTGDLKNAPSFIKNPGGAPANVAVCHAQLGGQAAVITKLGTDAFGDFLVDTLKLKNIDTQYIKRTSLYNTPLAFVALKENGDRDFTFYRSHSSDLYLEPSDIPATLFQSGDILHFGSVDLVDFPVKEAHKYAISLARNNHAIISFDPNLRFPLWPNKDALKATVNEFIPQADILKISDDELEFITGIKETLKAISSLFIGFVKLVILTKGSAGASIYSKEGKSLHVEGIKVKVIDATGAGDAFIGAFLTQLIENKKTVSSLLTDFEKYLDYLKFSNKVAALVCTRYGAIPAMPTRKEII